MKREPTIAEKIAALRTLADCEGARLAFEIDRQPPEVWQMLARREAEIRRGQR